jgi:hypothetical protein
VLSWAISYGVLVIRAVGVAVGDAVFTADGDTVWISLDHAVDAAAGEAHGIAVGNHTKDYAGAAIVTVVFAGMGGSSVSTDTQNGICAVHSATALHVGDEMFPSMTMLGLPFSGPLYPACCCKRSHMFRRDESGGPRFWSHGVRSRW